MEATPSELVGLNVVPIRCSDGDVVLHACIQFTVSADFGLVLVPCAYRAVRQQLEGLDMTVTELNVRTLAFCVTPKPQRTVAWQEFAQVLDSYCNTPMPSAAELAQFKDEVRCLLFLHTFSHDAAAEPPAAAPAMALKRE